MNNLIILLLVFLASCQLSVKEPEEKNLIPRLPASDVVAKSLIIIKKDDAIIPAFSHKSITHEQLKVVSGSGLPALFRISKLPQQGVLFLDGVAVVLKQDVTEQDLARGALSYQHNSLPGKDFFEVVAWNSEASSVPTRFELNISTPLPRACQGSNGTGTQIWNTISYGSCSIDNCDAGFFLEGEICEAQICTPNASESCPLPSSNGVGSKTCNANGSDFSSCSLNSCDSGFHLNGQACELNVAPCTVSGGEGIKTWSNGTYSQCQVTSCSPGFYQAANTCLAQICAPSAVSSCAISNGLGTTQCSINGSSLGLCLAQSCAQGYQLSANSCIAIPVSCAYNSAPSPVYEGVSFSIAAPVTQGYQVQYRLLSTSPGVVLNSNGSLNITPALQNYNIQVQAYSSTSTSNCGVAFTVTKSLVATDDSQAIMQGQSLVVPLSTLLGNDFSLIPRAFTLQNIVSMSGGTASIQGTDIRFTPTVMSGDSASFVYQIKDSFGTTASATVGVSVTPLPQLDALIYGEDETDDMLNLLNTTPPTMQDVFASWARFEDNNYYANKAASSGEALSWDFKTNPDRVESNFNSTKYIGFISPEKLDNFILETEISSTDSDDDSIAVLVAFVRSGNSNYTLSAVRTQGGSMTGILQGWALVYNYLRPDQEILTQLNVGGVNQNNAKNGWSGRTSRIKILRNGNSIKAWTSSWNVSTLTETSLIELNLTSQAKLSVFSGKQSYGFGAYSQKNSTYKNITLQGGSNLDATVIYDIDKQQVWRYTTASGWTLSTEDFSEAIGFPRTIYNPNTKLYYKIDRNGLVTPL